VNTWSVVFLGVIAVATLAMAIVQVGVLVAAGLLARRVGRFVDEIEREVKPILGHVNAITQVERVDQLWTDVARKVDQTLASVHTLILGPAREGRALILGFQAVMAAIREFRSRRSRSNGKEDEDGLFI
jgi:hypothetical protein